MGDNDLPDDPPVIDLRGGPSWAEAEAILRRIAESHETVRCVAVTDGKTDDDVRAAIAALEVKE